MNYTIIAEIGINWNGSMKLLKEMVFRAKDSGVDIAKTQLYDPSKLFPNKEVIVQGRNWYNEVEKTEMSFEQLSQFFEWCKEAEIEPMASAFDETRLQWLEMLGVHKHKIPSRMNQNIEYIKKVIDTGKEVIISFESKNVARTFSNEKYNQVSQIYCVPEYPTQLSDISLDELLSFVGFSDHTQGIEASIFAMANSKDVEGEYIIEKHFKLSESDIGPDMIISATPNEMKTLVHFARAFEEIQ